MKARPKRAQLKAALPIVILGRTATAAYLQAVADGGAVWEEVFVQVCTPTNGSVAKKAPQLEGREAGEKTDLSLKRRSATNAMKALDGGYPIHFFIPVSMADNQRTIKAKYSLANRALQSIKRQVRLRGTIRPDDWAAFQPRPMPGLKISGDEWLRLIAGLGWQYERHTIEGIRLFLIIEFLLQYRATESEKIIKEETLTHLAYKTIRLTPENVEHEFALDDQRLDLFRRRARKPTFRNFFRRFSEFLMQLYTTPQCLESVTADLAQHAKGISMQQFRNYLPNALLRISAKKSDFYRGHEMVE